MAEQVGLLGGSFDPIHNGHLAIARAVAQRLALDRVIFLPSANPPHKAVDRLSDAEHRAAMVRLAIAGEPLFDFSDYDLTRSGPSYTIDTVAHFHRLLGSDVGLFWIIGGDTLAELAAWHRVRELVDNCRIVTASRPGWTTTDWSRLQTVLTSEQITRLRADVLDTPLVDISSTDIRNRVRQGQSIAHLVPEEVYRYIDAQRLYC
ncbi:MAG: nicotinate-nucleotide adenylyltransferase [Planctomycetes bacterium]|nr:nicotinate-nucleotide adenylyltransferase [Planctomycetota bacterium]